MPLINHTTRDPVPARSQSPPLLPSAGLSPPDVFLVERLSDWDWYEIQSMSGWRRRFGVGAGAVGVVAEMSLSAGWLSVD